MPLQATISNQMLYNGYAEGFDFQYVLTGSVSMKIFRNSIFAVLFAISSVISLNAQDVIITSISTTPVTCGNGSDGTVTVTISGGGRLLAGALTGVRGEARLVRVDDHSVNLPPARHMLVVHNQDQPGMIGAVGRILADVGVNIADMSVGQSAEGAALMVISANREIPQEAANLLVAADGIVDARIIELPDN